MAASSSSSPDGEEAATEAATAAAEALSSSSSSSVFHHHHLLLPDASAPVAAAASLIDSIGPTSASFISLPWWAAIPTAAVAVRAALLPLSLAQARSAAAFGPLMQRAREEIEEEDEEERFKAAAAAAAALKEDEQADDSPTKDPQQRRLRRKPPPALITRAMLRRLLALRRQTSSPHPLWLVASPLLQLPIFASAVLGVRAMANAEWPGFREGGALWFSDLTARAVEIVGASSSSAAAAASISSLSLASLSAPMGVAGGVLPALVAAGTLAAAASAFSGRAGGAGSARPPPPPPALRLLLEWLALPAFVGSLLLPQGAVLYWASSSGAALAQGWMLRSQGARELLGLREIAERARSGGGVGGGGGSQALSSHLSPSSSSSSSSATPPAALAHLSRAAELRASGDVEKAIRAASAAVACSGNRSPRAWFALGQLRAAAAHWYDAEIAFWECARLEEEEEEAEVVSKREENDEGKHFRSLSRKHEVARALFGAGVAQSMQGDSEAASDTLRRAVAAAEEALGGAGAVQAEVEKRRKRSKRKEKAKPLSPQLATLARSLLALSSSLDAQGGANKTSEALAFARRAAALDEGAERMAVAPLVEKLRREEKEEEREREAKEEKGGTGGDL